MTDRLDGARILIYSHDSFGLGHLRRCRTIAHALVERYKGLSVLILSGSPIIGSFDFKARVDFVRIPGVIKLHNGEYTSLGLHIDLEDTLAMRASIIQHTAQIFGPDLFLVDKEPLGLKGEIETTLEIMKQNGTTNVLGLRDVMDSPPILKAEWERKRVRPALESLYDEIWIYGAAEACAPLAGLEMPASIEDKLVYTGYLPRYLPSIAEVLPPPHMEPPYLLITAGGGGDGGPMFDWVLRAYERYHQSLTPALFVLGPFMPPTQQREFQERIAGLANAQVLTFDSHIEQRMARAAGVVAMGGYNTFCEILSLDKPALLIPRRLPREEQLVRARCAAELGLVTMLDDTDAHSVETMYQALRRLPQQAPPSVAAPAGLLSGLDRVCERTVEHVLGTRSNKRVRLSIV